MRLDKYQLKTRKRIKKSGIYDCTNLPYKEREVISFLRSKNLLNAKTKNGLAPTSEGMRPYEISLLNVSISENGNAFLSEFHTDNFRFTVPTIISTILSLAAIVISIIALLK